MANIKRILIAKENINYIFRNNKFTIPLVSAATEVPQELIDSWLKNGIRKHPLRSQFLLFLGYLDVRMVYIPHTWILACEEIESKNYNLSNLDIPEPVILTKSRKREQVQQRRNFIQETIKANANLPDGELAELCKCNEQTVKLYRERLNIPKVKKESVVKERNKRLLIDVANTPLIIKPKKTKPKKEPPPPIRAIKKKAAIKLMQENPELPIHEVAKQCDLSLETVKKYRGSLKNRDIPELKAEILKVCRQVDKVTEYFIEKQKRGISAAVRDAVYIALDRLVFCFDNALPIDLRDAKNALSDYEDETGRTSPSRRML